jgi:hypothetical protein
MRRARSRRDSREIDLYPLTRRCPACRKPLRERYRKRRFIVRLDEQLDVTSHFLQCPAPSCRMREAVYRPEEEGVLALRGYTFGLDVVALVGELRYGSNRSIPEIHAHLVDAGLEISDKEVSLLAEVFLALVTTSAAADAEAVDALRALGGLVLSIDGVQPEKGNETLYLLRELQTGRVLVARNLRSSSTAELQKLIDEVLALGVPIVGVVSDKQESICLAIARSLPGVPHQVCQYHYLRDMAHPVADADRHLKKEIKKRVRGIKAVEDSAERLGQTAEARIALDYCQAIRVVMRNDGKYPLDPAGLELYTKLEKIAASIERAIAARGSKLLERVLRILTVLGSYTDDFERITTAYGWIWQIAHTLEVEGVRASTAQRRLERYVAGLEAGEDEELGEWLAHIRKLTGSFAGRLFTYVGQPLLPKTNNELELFIGRLKKARRQATGRKSTAEYILREGQYVAILYGLPTGSSDIERLAEVDFDAFKTTLEAMRRRQERSKAWRVRRDLDSYLSDLEQDWPASE